jgi:hypothetical protein
MKRFALFLLSICLFIWVIPVFAQDGTPIFNFQWTFERVLIAALLLVVVVQQFALYKSSPPAFIKLFFGFLKEQAALTPAKWDDEAVSFGEETYGKLASQPPETQATASKFSASGDLQADMAALRRTEPPGSL